MESCPIHIYTKSPPLFYSCFTLTCDEPLLSSHRGACSLTLSVASPQQLLGQFSGQLADGSGQLFSLESGVFDIWLDQVIPDLDQDGLSDADDNCPFDANPDQQDSDGNRMGDACDPNAQDDA